MLIIGIWENDNFKPLFKLHPNPLHKSAFKFIFSTASRGGSGE